MMSMIENCTISKKGKLGDDCGGSDLLSELPLSIIHIILAFVQIKDAVRTSILSTQWRYTWTTLPQLVFGNDCARDELEYEKFISQVLFHHKGPILKLRMSCSHLFPNAEWILCLSRKGIRELFLDLEFCYNYSIEIRSSIYSCEKLTSLRLHQCAFDPPPVTFKGFMFLKSLYLDTPHISSDGICSFVSVCPLLEDFELINLDEPELKISAPNLKYMRVVGEHGKICIDAPLMSEISVELHYYDLEATGEGLKFSSRDYAKCFAGFTNLQKLSGSCYFTKFLSFGIKLSHHSLVFRHLKLLDLDYVDFQEIKEIMVVAHLVIGAPNLQELKIGTPQESRIDDLPLSFKDLQCPSNFKLEKLTVVSLSNINCLSMEVDFLKFLLEISPALETMRVTLLNDTEENRNDLRAKLEGCNWASPTVKLCNREETRQPYMTPAAKLIDEALS